MDSKKQNQAETDPGIETEDDGSISPGKEDDNNEKVDPTRYGDWEKKGRCIDF